jgi:RNA polymerase sigma-70 factor (ECF subfamily)
MTGNQKNVDWFKDPLDNITQLLRRSRAGDRGAMDEVITLVYAELHRFAESRAWHQRDQTLPPKALLNEAYLRLASRAQPDWQDRKHFYRVVRKIMKQILADHADAKLAKKRHGIRVELKDELNQGDQTAADQDIALREALTVLAKMNKRQAKALELRYIKNLTPEEIAKTLGISEKTVRRDIKAAKTWLREQWRQKPLRTTHRNSEE